MRYELGFFVLVLAVVLPCRRPVFCNEQEQKQAKQVSVSARVVGGSGQGAGILATKEPGEFTVPEGQKATGFKYSFHDPKTGFKSTSLSNSSIYSVTEQEYIEAEGEGENLELPPGKYKFVVGGGVGASGSLSFKLTPGDASSASGKKGKKSEKPNVVCTEGTYVLKDGTRHPVPEVTKDSPLELRFRNGQLKGEHSATQFLNGNTLRMQWTTTIDASLRNGKLSGSYEQFHTLTDLSDKTLKDGFMCNKRWLSGKITGRLDDNGHVHVQVSGWQQKDMVREYGARAQANGSVRLYELKPWHEATDPLPEFHIEFELQLPIKAP